MKNSEMKTIIRHIDRLTRSLNVKARRRDAFSFSMNDKDLSLKKNALKHQCDVMSQMLEGCDKEFSKSGYVQKKINSEDFESAKKYTESFAREIKRFDKVAVSILTLINEAIKIQRG